MLRKDVREGRSQSVELKPILSVLQSRGKLWESVEQLTTADRKNKKKSETK
jgi:hypothetical protein